MRLRVCATFLVLIVSSATAVGDVIATSSANGITGVRDSSDDFFGLVTVGSTTSSISIDTTPATVELTEALGAIDPGDVVGRDTDGLSSVNQSGVLWTYDLTLPGSAIAGTGLNSISFSADMLFSDGAFDGNSGDTANDLTFRLLLNGIEESSTTHEAVGNGESAVSLSAPGGASVTSAQITVEILNSSAFNGGNESFAVTNAVFSAQFTAVPEPTSAAVVGISLAGMLYRRRRT